VTPVRAYGLAFDAPVLGSANLSALALSAIGDDRHLPVQDRHDPDHRRLLRRRHRDVSGRRHRLSRRASGNA